MTMPRQNVPSPCAVWSRSRRQINKDNGVCINENKRGTHGAPVPGHIRCQRCIDVHTRSR